MAQNVTLERVHFYDTDAMQVVHHANYLRWFETGRVEFLRRAGITLGELIEDGIVFPIREARCKYRQSARFDDVVRIETEPAALTQVKMAFRYRVFRDSDGALLAEGATENVFTDRATGKIVKIPAKYYEKLQAAGK